jgi:5-hydroxyisourate hydrolase
MELNMTNPMDRREVLGAASLAAAASVLGSGEGATEPAGGILNVHVLDLYSGTPASGVKVDLFMRQGEQMTAVKSVVTDADGRSGTLLAGDAFAAGRYLLAVDLSDYFKGVDKTLPPNFFRKLSLEFEVTEPTVPHHIPLQCTPWTQACSVLPG